MQVRLKPRLQGQKQRSTGRILHFNGKFHLNFRRNLVKRYISSTASKMLGKFQNMVLEKDWEYQLDVSCEKWMRAAWSQWEEEYHVYNEKEED